MASVCSCGGSGVKLVATVDDAAPPEPGQRTAVLQTDLSTLESKLIALEQRFEDAEISFMLSKLPDTRASSDAYLEARIFAIMEQRLVGFELRLTEMTAKTPAKQVCSSDTDGPGCDLDLLLDNWSPVNGQSGSHQGQKTEPPLGPGAELHEVASFPDQEEIEEAIVVVEEAKPAPKALVPPDANFCASVDGEHELHGTVYEVVLFAFTSATTTSESVILIVALIVNLVMQVLLILCIPALTEEARSKVPDLDDAKSWRETAMHDSVLWQSMASRVCAEDDSLHVASAQMEDVAMLRIRTKSFFPFADEPTTGPMVFYVVMFLWNVFYMMEWLSISGMVSALFQFNVGATVISEIEGVVVVETISRFRRSCLLLVQTLRGAINVGLYIATLAWLMATFGIADMLLNATAMVIVLDLDEALFDLAVPIRIARLHNMVKPLPMKYNNVSTVFFYLLCPLLMPLCYVYGVHDSEGVLGAMCPT